jgi:hypothetical protein
MTTGWNPSCKAKQSVLSNDNLTLATDAYCGWDGGAESITGQTTGKWYWEITIDTLGSRSQSWYGMYIGLEEGLQTNDSTAWYHFGGLNTNWILFERDGKFYNKTGAAISSAVCIYTLGDTIRYAWDSVNGYLWASKTSSWASSGNPTTGANPHVTGAKSTTGAIYAMAYIGTGNPGDKITANFGASAFKFAIPIGYNGYTGWSQKMSTIF